MHAYAIFVDNNIIKSALTRQLRFERVLRHVRDSSPYKVWVRQHDMKKWEEWQLSVPVRFKYVQIEWCLPHHFVIAEWCLSYYVVGVEWCLSYQVISRVAYRFRQTKNGPCSQSLLSSQTNSKPLFFSFFFSLATYAKSVVTEHVFCTALHKSTKLSGSPSLSSVLSRKARAHFLYTDS